MIGSHSATHHVVLAEVTMRLLSAIDADTAVAVELRYSTRDPYAVRATFRRDRHTPVVWIFARELLLVGAARRTGVGDVRVSPVASDIIIELRSPEGHATLAAPADAIRRFNTQMLALVAPGDELRQIDLEAELDLLERPTVPGSET